MHCTVLYCIALLCSAIQYNALYYPALNCTAVHCIALLCTANAQSCPFLFCTHCTTLHCSVLYFLALSCTALHCTILYCTALHCIKLHCTALNYTTLHCTALHCTVLYNSFNICRRKSAYCAFIWKFVYVLCSVLRGNLLNYSLRVVASGFVEMILCFAVFCGFLLVKCMSLNRWSLYILITRMLLVPVPNNATERESLTESEKKGVI